MRQPFPLATARWAIGALAPPSGERYFVEPIVLADVEVGLAD